MNGKFITGLMASSVAVLVISCQSVDVTKVDKGKYDIKDVCIVLNPAVIVEDFVPALQAVLEQRGITSKVIPKEEPACNYRLVYTANQSWDGAIYVSFISMILYKGETVTGRGTYSAGFWFSKFGPVDEKIRIVTNELLADFSQRSK
jgi:hypothetical protein